MYPDWSKNISILDLSQNKIDDLRSRSFWRLNSLRYIDLRYNEISSIHHGNRWSFIFNWSPIILQSPGCFLLGHNSLEYFLSRDYIFDEYIRIQTQAQFIDFSFNKITYLSRNNFQSFNFSQMSLSGNKLKKLI